jgi:hypothetical protein
MIPLHSYRWKTRQAFRTAVPGEQELYQESLYPRALLLEPKLL